MKLIATTAMGLEAVVGRELEQLGYQDRKASDGRVTLEASPLDIPRLNLWLRSAGRVKIEVGSFEATSFDALFEGVKALPWAELLPEDAEFPVLGRSVKSALFSVRDCQAISKKAIVEAMRIAHPSREWFEEDGALYRIEVEMRNDQATLTLDTSGEGLHKRGYRAEASQAPLRETIAAALVQLSFWNSSRSLIDLFCGSGTIPIEAALIGRNIAPGRKREFVSEAWPWIGAEAWKRARQEADDLAQRDGSLDIQGRDLDPRMVELSARNADLAGVGDATRFTQMRATDFLPSPDYGVAISNPPYGQRMGEADEVEALYAAMGRIFKAHPTWTHYWLSGHERFEQAFGMRADRRRKLFNAGIAAQYYQYYGPPPPRTLDG